MVEALRTPDARFTALPDYSFAPHYLDGLTGFDGLRMHYLDVPSEAGSGPVFLCLHGQPTWSYLYRRMIPVLAKAGRVIAPDLFGFGRSDKPVVENWYSIARHRDSLLAFIAHLDLQDIVLVCQDWGGLLGLTLPVAMPERFKRLLIMNTTIPTGELDLGEGFKAWRAYNRSRPDLAVGELMKRSTPFLTAAEAAAYDAPFPDSSYKAGVRQFPELVPDGFDAPGADIGRAARDYLRDHWTGDSFMAIGMKDPVLTPRAMYHLRTQICNCPAPMELADAGHFVQESGAAVAHAALKAFGLTS